MIGLRRVAAVLGVLVVLSGCAGQPGQSSTTRPPDWPFAAALPPSPDYRQPSSDSAYGRAAEAIGETGMPSRETALRLFALGVAPVPGVDAATDGATIRSASFATRAVLAHWSELTPDQKAAIEAALAVPPGTVTIEIEPVAERTADRPLRMAGIGPGLAPAPIVAQADAPYTQEVIAALRSAGDWVRAAVAGRMGDDITGAIQIDLAPCEPYNGPEANGANALGCANGFYASPSGPSLVGSGPYDHCRVRVTGSALAGGAAVVVNTLAHEIFHCFQFAGYGTLARIVAAPSWVVEGGAEWVGNDIAGELAETDGFWDKWILEPGQSLQGRSYSAVGFWGHLDETGTNPYNVFPFVFLAGDGKIAFRSSGAADNQRFLDSWASSITRKADWGRDWDTDDVGITTTAAGPELWEVPNDSSSEIHTDAYTARVMYLDVSADVISISGTGHARVSDGKVDTTQFPARFCTRSGGCQPCPPANDVPPAPLGTSPWFVLTGGVDGSTFTVVGERVDDACETPEPPSPDPSDDDEFCHLYRAMIDWIRQNTTPDSDMTKDIAGEIAKRSRAMKPFAPTDLVDDVDVFIQVYGTYADAPGPGTSLPIDVPLAGRNAQYIPAALSAMNAYCGIAFP